MKIEFEAHFGHETKTIELVAPSGGGQGYQLMIDKYYQGRLIKTQGKWVGKFNPGCDLTVDDINILGEMIDNALA
ncbi:hypothetical protein [Chitinophaga sp. S165]|uniref:hypothetical protein n=1 Tax=Chitinophaga sp. S165 TaxID=2135462 RepID=UPI0011B6C650|nr:hypothetical protein [Chitinophaga sp. S165]